MAGGRICAVHSDGCPAKGWGLDYDDVWDYVLGVIDRDVANDGLELMAHAMGQDEKGCRW